MYIDDIFRRLIALLYISRLRDMFFFELYFNLIVRAELAFHGAP